MKCRSGKRPGRIWKATNIPWKDAARCYWLSTFFSAQRPCLHFYDWFPVFNLFKQATASASVMLPLLSSLTSWSIFSSAFSTAVATSCPICFLVSRQWMAKAVGLSFLLCGFITYFSVDSAFGALVLASTFFSAFSSFCSGGSPVGTGDPFTVSSTSCDCGHPRFRK